MDLFLAATAGGGDKPAEKTLYVDPEDYPAVANGTKTIEARLARPGGDGPGGIKAGDVVRVTAGPTENREQRGDFVLRLVTRVEHFPSFAALLEAHLDRVAPAQTNAPGLDRVVAVAAEAAKLQKRWARGETADLVRGAAAIHLAPPHTAARRTAANPVVLQRNSTSFLYEVQQMLGQIRAREDGLCERDEYFGVNVRGLRLHQARVVVCACSPQFRTDARGMLIAHQMGSGKGITAAAILHHEATAGRPCVFYTSRTLIGNFQDSIQVYEKVSGNHVPTAQVRYATMNASNSALQVVRAIDTAVAPEVAASSQADQQRARRKNPDEADDDDRGASALQVSTQLAKENASMDSVSFFVDEAHLWARAVTNGSANATAIYEILRRSPKARVFLFTGTPAVDDPFELAILFNAVGPTKPLPLPETYADFHRAFVQPRGGLRNADKFMNRLVGLSSWQDADPALLPELLPPQLHHIPMTPEQYKLYAEARELEREEALEQEAENAKRKRRGNRPDPRLVRPGAGEGSSTYRQRSRQAGDSYWEGTELRSPKAAKVLDLAAAAEHMVVMYSQYLTRGSGAVVAEARHRGWREFGDPAAEPNKVYALLTGDTEMAQRQQVVAIANSDNFNGERIKLFIVSVVAALGVSLLWSNEVIIYEPYWNDAMHQQIIARVRRFDSFTGYPDKRRVTAHILVAVPPTPPDQWGETPTDIHLWQKATINAELVGHFRQACMRVGIEAAVAKHPAARLCQPTAQRLYADTLGIDLASADPCEPFTSAAEKTYPIKLPVPGEYRWMRNPDDAFGATLLEFSPDLAAWTAVQPRDPASIAFGEMLVTGQIPGL